MAETLTLLEFLRELFTNVELRDHFAANPEGALDEYGLSNLSPADVHDALVLVEDNQTADFSRDYNTGGNGVQYAPPPPPPVHYDGGDHEAAVEYLNTYITNNYIDDRDTIVDNSVNQQVDTGGGAFDQDIDIDSVVASGDGAVAAGEDIEDSTVVTGDDNQVGEGNVRGDGNVVGAGNQAVTGDANTTAFGAGDATSTTVGDDLTVGDGSAFATGGSAAVDNSDNSLNQSFDDSFNDNSDNSVNDSGNLDIDASVNDSGNDNSTTSIEDSGNDNSDNSIDIDNSQEDVVNIG